MRFVTFPLQNSEAFAVYGTTLLGLLKNSHSEEVELAIENKENVGVKAGKSRFKLPYFGKDEFLFKLPADKWGISLTIDEHLLKGLAACLLTSSRDLSQPAWLGVSLQPTGKRMTLYSCDGDGVTRYTTAAKAAQATGMLPNSFCETVLRISKESGSEGGTLSLNTEWAKAELQSGFTVYGRLIEINAPVDFEHEIDKTLEGKWDFVALPRGLDHALSRASVIADALSTPTTIEIAEGKLRLITENQMGRIVDVLPLPKHSDIAVDVSAAMMQRAIGLCTEMAVLERCTVYREGETLFMVVGNMG